MIKTISSNYQELEKSIDSIILNFDKIGDEFGKFSRNKIKLFSFGETKLNVKSFKVPMLINRIIYGTFRKSKARRSFEFAKRLNTLGIKSPEPIAYYENSNYGFFGKSYYVSEHLNCDLTFRELTKDLNYPDHEIILRAFTRFTFQLHQKGVNFLDHSPGNTLIVKKGLDYDFYLVDLNRMEFMKMNFKSRIKNFSKLTSNNNIVGIMSDEYSKCSNESFEDVYNLMWKYTCDFQYKFNRKKRIKKLLFFWK